MAAGRGDLGGGNGIEHTDIERPLTMTGLLDGAAQQAPVSADRLVGLPEMLPGAVLDRSHQLARPLIVHVDISAHAGEGLGLLLLGIEAVIVALVLART